MNRSARDWFMAWCILCSVIGASVLIFVSVGHNASRGTPLILPLDDVYIHFQYARMAADGQPFRYNSGDPPTSGATSLLYPFLLAVGYRIGFQADRLAFWAVFIGALSWLGSAWLILRLLTWRDRLSLAAGLLITLAFVGMGSLSWAFMSGMETGLLTFAGLLTLWCVVRGQFWATIAAATLVALIRPEGAVIAVGALIYIYTEHRNMRQLPPTLNPSLLVGERLSYVKPFPSLWGKGQGMGGYWIGLVPPLVAILIQPILNLLLTGSITATGMQAKSYLYNVPFDAGVLISTVSGVFVRIWHEMLSGVDTDGVVYGTTLIVLIAVIGLVLAFVVRSMRRDAVLIVFWLIGLTAIISVLETAFWQFKRYQQPMIAFLFVLGGWGVAGLIARLNAPIRNRAALLIGGLLLLGSLSTWLPFLGYYHDNVAEVASSQVSMAQYVAATLPPDARIGVHDIGVMRYLGDRPTYDVVGLTTPGAARAWRNGPGAVYEQMRQSPNRPADFAIYTDAHGLSYFDQTDLFQDVLARFESTRPAHNVASAANEQIVTHADWSQADAADQLWQPSSLAAIRGLTAVDSINVADLPSEDAHAYRWWQSAQRPGFPTELYEMPYLSCAPVPSTPPVPSNPTCTVIDGGRLITGGEEMTINTQPGADLIWITRVHARDEGTLALFADGQAAAARVLPGGLGGHWLEIATLIPGRLITHTQTRLRVEASLADGHYMPYYHWFYQGHFQPDTTRTLPDTIPDAVPADEALFNNGVRLLGHQLTLNGSTLSVHLEWEAAPGGARGDDKLFIHLYEQSRASGAPIAQVDTRPGGGTLPPGNWLPGVISETYTLTVPPGEGVYRVAIGLYDAVTTQRVFVTGGDKDNRLFIGTIASGF